ncbi:hypothetical protein EGR_05207 [Echinococcus granulosus]|uniref:Uncharacterized protein n=1 Tax=Echinococcus granulosus TaxID=6210 RepID=W6UFX9_ECHGR|nr:hypothetical protein EGR_05207 [Echinococcus granulosus]EUB59881.1 hypothetical protein EGR_05207 [Echinococcus granulosus]
MLAGITNKSIQLSDVDDVFVSPNKRRKGNASYKCKSEFPINDIVDTIEPINLTHKIDDENQQFKESDNISLPSSISNFQLSLAAQLQNVDFNTNVNTTPEVTTRQSIPFVLPFLPRRFPFLLPFENLTTGNKAEAILEQRPKSSHLYHEFAQVSKSFSFSPCGTVNKNTFASKENSSVLQLLHSCLEQIPLPPIGSDCQEILNSLYTYTIFQAINFQKSVLRYLTELNEKTRPRPSEPKDPWNLHSNDKSLQPNLYAFSRSTSSDCKSLESTLLANDSESGAAIDLRVRPPKSALDGCSINFGRATLPHDSCIQESSADCLDSGRISGFLSHAFNRRSPSLSSYPNDLSDAFPPRHLFSRFAVRSPSRCLNGRRLKTTSLKNKKPRSLGGYSPSSSTPGRDSQCSGPLLSKKPSFRGTSEEENEVCPHFKPVEQNVSLQVSAICQFACLKRSLVNGPLNRKSIVQRKLLKPPIHHFFLEFVQ